MEYRSVCMVATEADLSRRNDMTALSVSTPKVRELPDDKRLQSPIFRKLRVYSAVSRFGSNAPEFESTPYQKYLFNADLRDLLRAIESAMSNYPIGGVILFSSSSSEPPADTVNTAETPSNEPPLENAQSSFNERIKLLGECTGYKLQEGQVLALQELYNRKDVILVAMTGFGKTLIIMGFNLLFNAEDRFITVIIRPLKNRHDIARGMYTHVWTSAKIALGDLYEDEDTQGVGDARNDEGKGVDRL
ncbi:hypothetical protein K469DRAFT_687515 [Zopfia rhizophila CBS 207.26]|uniref:DEAD/DEAH box helicase domain-containing protein n=1 Tax=Zopfia rhizophila CBS 207.26 TaxID=1314779 RepID=A0A6A6E2U9_9PEZI|nr:hypothetical protein K469DRAFT_687515 [Zopfia rhizophila CBS 207.26]